MAKQLDAPAIPNGVEFWPECTLCPKLCDNSLNVCMEGEGPSNAKLMILGEAPGATEDELNRPFVGQAGDFLRDDLLVPAKIPESEVRFENTVRCHPPKNRNPSAKEIINCRRYLEVAIRRVKPKMIVGMGNVPLATMLSRFYKGAQEEGTAKKSDAVVGGITQWRGRLIWLREFNCWFLPTFHPSYCMRNERKRSEYSTNLVIEDLKRAWSIAQKPINPSREVKSVSVEDPAMLRDVIREMREAETFAFDIETGVNQDDPNIPTIIGASLACSETKGYYFSWDVAQANKRTWWGLLGLLGDNKLTKVMHNGAYEVRVFRFNNLPIHDRYVDTMAAAHLVDENFSKRLKDLAWVLTDFGGYDVPLEKYKHEHKIKADYSKIPYTLLARYGALDSVATYALYKKLYKEMKREKMLPLFEKIVMPVRRVMSDAEYAGIHVDIKQAEAVAETCQKAISKLEEKVYECAGREFNIGSNQQLARILYKEMGFSPLKETKTGYSVDKDSIDYIATQSDSEIAHYLSDRAYISTMLGTHISQAINFRWDLDGRIHAHYNITGAVTGRASCSNPSLQNVPQDALVRSVYAATPGNWLTEADLKQAELATIAAVSGERTFLDAFERGLDIHSQTYRRLYDLPQSYQPTKLERRAAKAVNFGLVFGISAIGLAKGLKITIEEAQDFMNLYFDRMPNIKQWMERQKALVKKNGYVVSVFNRKRRLPYALSDSWGDQGRAERQAMNAPVQSGAADYTYIGLIRLSRILKKNKFESKIVHTVHDCGLVDTIPVEEDYVVEAFHEAFETPVKVLPVNMKIDVEVNRRWGENNESRLQEIFDSFGLKVAA